MVYHRDPLLFNIYINDIFFFIEKTKIANYADDNTTYCTEETLDILRTTLQKETRTVLKWFHDNEMKSNDDKCHLRCVSRGGAVGAMFPPFKVYTCRKNWVLSDFFHFSSDFYKQLN